MRSTVSSAMKTTPPLLPSALQPAVVRPQILTRFVEPSPHPRVSQSALRPRAARSSAEERRAARQASDPTPMARQLRVHPALRDLRQACVAQGAQPGSASGSSTTSPTSTCASSADLDVEEKGRKGVDVSASEAKCDSLPRSANAGSSWTPRTAQVQIDASGRTRESRKSVAPVRLAHGSRWQRVWELARSQGGRSEVERAA